MPEKEQTIENEYPLDQLYFYLTQGCNLRCRHCWLAPEYRSEEKPGTYLPVDLFKQIIKEAKDLGLTSVKLTGGEPLLDPDIQEMLEYIRSEELGLTVETNGLLCTPEIARQLSLCRDVFVSVSLDASKPEIHDSIRGVKGAFKKTINGVKSLVNAGIKPQIIMSIMRQNKDDIEPLVMLAQELGAESVKFNMIEPTSRGKKMHEKDETLSVEELIALEKWVDQELSPKVEIRLMYDAPAAFRPLSKMFGKNGNGCSVCGIKNILGVISDGSYALCGIGEKIPELVFGEAGKDRLFDVWNKTSILKQLRDKLPEKLEGICAQCLMKSRCLGSCIAQNYYRNKSLFAPFWFCEEADRNGLFPESRKGSAEKCFVVNRD